MQKLKLLLSSLLVLLFAINSISQTTFNHRYRFDFPAAVLTSIIPTDSCYYATGIIADSIFPYNTGNIFLKLDLEGNVGFLKTLRDTNKTYETWRGSLTETPDSNFVVSGYQIDTMFWAIIIKYNPMGDTLFIKKYPNYYHPDDDFSSPFDLTLTSNNGFAFVDWNRNPEGFLDDQIIVQYTDSLGNLLWAEDYGNHLYDKPATIKKDGDGNLIIGAVKRNTNYVDQNYTGQNYIFKIDSLGNEIWSYLSPIDQLMDGARDIVLEEDGSMIIATQTGVETYVNPNTNALKWDKGLIYKLNNDRQKIWEVGFRDPTRPNILNELTKLVKISDGSGYVAVGQFVESYPDLSANLFGWLVKASPEGDSLWSRSLRFFEEDDNLHYLYDVKETPDGGFIMVGQANEYYAEAYPQQAWIIKVDQYGCLVPGCHLLDDVEENQVQGLQLLLHPNPASDFLNVYMKAGLGEKVNEFRIIDTSGKVMASFFADQFDTTYMIPVNDYPPGIYFLQIATGEGIIKTEKFVILR